MLQCRRCLSAKLIPLSKGAAGDNLVFRCAECGFLFSPAAAPVGANSQAGQSSPRASSGKEGQR